MRKLKKYGGKVAEKLPRKKTLNVHVIRRNQKFKVKSNKQVCGTNECKSDVEQIINMRNIYLSLQD